MSIERIRPIDPIQRIGDRPPEQTYKGKKKEGAPEKSFKEILKEALEEVKKKKAG